MRSIIAIALAGLAAIGTRQANTGAQAVPDLFISHGTVIDGTDAPPAVRGILIRNGTIAALLPAQAAAPPGATVVDARGRFVIPGLWDMHVHLAVRPEPELAERIMLPAFLAYGIVGVRDMGGPLERVLSLRDRVARGEIEGPRILTPGPFVDGPGDEDPSVRHVTDATGARALVAELAGAGVDFIKVQANLTRGPYDAVIDEAARRKDCGGGTRADGDSGRRCRRRRPAEHRAHLAGTGWRCRTSLRVLDTRGRAAGGAPGDRAGSIQRIP